MPILLLPSLSPSTQQCARVFVRLRECVYLCSPFAACVRLSVNIALAGAPRFFSFLASFKSFHAQIKKKRGWNVKFFPGSATSAQHPSCAN